MAKDGAEKQDKHRPQENDCDGSFEGIGESPSPNGNPAQQIDNGLADKRNHRRHEDVNNHGKKVP